MCGQLWAPRIAVTYGPAPFGRKLEIALGLAVGGPPSCARHAQRRDVHVAGRSVQGHGYGVRSWRGVAECDEQPLGLRALGRRALEDLAEERIEGSELLRQTLNIVETSFDRATVAIAILDDRACIERVQHGGLVEHAIGYEAQHTVDR